MNPITLTTDFGARDWFVGTMKGVIAGITPANPVIDITHEVPPGNIREGAFALAAAAPFFPDGSIHVAVVDPGVGSDRPAIAVRTPRATFIGPDNGVLSWALRDQPINEIRRLDNPAWFRHPVSYTFHGRDLFAPVAARLAAGAPFEETGELLTDLIRLPWPQPTRGDRSLTGEVIHIDRFGNAITNLPAGDLPADRNLLLHCGDITTQLRTCYADVGSGQAVAVPGSSGFIELAVNGGNFASKHGPTAGTAVTATW